MPSPSPSTLAPHQPIQFFALRDVRVQSIPFLEAMRTDHAYLLRLEPDRLLAGFRREAGLPPKAQVYGGWESMGIAGHSLGHYLSALSLMFAATGDPELKQRSDTIVSELANCQRANGDGYLGATPGGKRIYADVKAGRIQSKGGFSLNEGWVPVYALHKVFAGLLDAFHQCDNEQAREVVIALTNWADEVFGALSYEQMQQVLFVEHGGMAESLAEVYALSGDERHLKLARHFRHDEFFLPALENRDTLSGRHANTQIPKFIGYERIYELTGETDWKTAARNFWNFVARERSFVIGGNSVSEHFFPTDKFDQAINSGVGPETCNTANMLRLSRHLFAQQPDDAANIMDFYERALWNHILGSQHPQHGGFVYYTGVRPGSYRTYSNPCDCFWCCVGTGMENHARYGESIYAHSKDKLWVNLFIESRVTWREHGAVVSQRTDFPNEPRTALHFDLKSPARFTLSVRYPGWVSDGALEIEVNGERVSFEAKPGDYVHIERQWHTGDVVSVELPMRVTAELLPASNQYAALLFGPIVLVGKQGRGDVSDAEFIGDAVPIPSKFVPSSEQPTLVGTPADIAAQVSRDPNEPLTFHLPAANATLVPLFQLHDERYTMYWPLVPDETALEERRARFALQQQREEELAARTLDSVQPGEQQSEVDHDFRGEQTKSGYSNERGWRHAENGGWFSYRLNIENADRHDLELICTTWSADQPARTFDIFVDDALLVTATSGGQDAGEWVDASYPIPRELTQNKRALVVKWQPKPGDAAGIYGCRLLLEAKASAT